MKIRLHNKYEVTCGDKTYVAYNTMLKSVFDKIKNLEPYNSYFAFGTGSNAVNFETSKLGSYVATYAATTEQVQPDCKAGDMFVIKSKVFGENEGNGLTFSEIGLTDTTDSNPTIYNHVVLTDEDGEIVSVTKQAGKEMVIRLTIYLESVSGGNAKLVAGDNLLVKQLLGENAMTNTSLTFTRGINNQPNVEIYREPPKQISACEYEKLTYDLTDFTGVGIKYDCNFGENEVREIVVLADGKPVIRYNCLGARSPEEVTATKTKNTNNCVDLGDDVKLVTSCTSQDSTTTINFVLNSYAHSFGDYISSPFDMPFDDQTTRFVAKDGTMIAFILNQAIYIYKNEDLLIKKLDTSAVSASNVDHIFMFGDLVFTKLTTSPYLKCYKVTDYVCEPVTLSAQTYNLNLTGMDITQSKDNVVRIAGIDSSTRGVCLLASFNDAGELVVSSKIESTYTGIEKVACLYQNNYCDSLVFFLTTQSNGITGIPSVDMVDEDGQLDSSVSSSLATMIISGSTESYGTDRVLCCKKPSVEGSAIYNTYFFPEAIRYNIANDGEIDLYASPDFKYVIKKYSSTSYKIFNIIGYNLPVEFDDNFFSTLTQSEFLSFEFLKDSLLIFTSNTQKPIIAINLNQTSAMLEGLKSTDPSEVSVTYQKYQPLGSGSGEVVEAKLTLTVGGFNE